MRPRDLFRLPLGDYVLTDGIYKFSLQKELKTWGDNMPFYKVRQYGSVSTGNVNFYEEMDNVFEDSSRYKQKVLSFIVFVTGMSFSGKDCWNQIHNLRFVPRSSYKEWLKIVEQINVIAK